MPTIIDTRQVSWIGMYPDRNEGRFSDEAKAKALLLDLTLHVGKWIGHEQWLAWTAVKDVGYYSAYLVKGDEIYCVVGTEEDLFKMVADPASLGLRWHIK